MSVSKFVSGDIIKEGDLERIARVRAQKELEQTVDKPFPLKYKRDNWKIKKEYTNSLRIFKEKKFDELFEDEVWLLFKKMGFSEMNKDRHLIIGEGVNRKQIDVFAKDKNHIFIVECKSSEKPEKRDLAKDIREILQIKGGIIKALRNYYSEGYRYTFLLLTKNINVPKSNMQLAKENSNKNFYLWKEEEIESYKNLAYQFGEHSRFIMYSILFENRNLAGVDTVKVPAILGGKGANKYYLFIIQPEKLLNGITYIHRREERNPEESLYAYQRMLNRTRLARIKEFVQAGGYFANNIIVNFTSEPNFERKANVGDIVWGILTFPKLYGSAWIIDGQHRLYGYLDSGKSADSYMPVLAFNNIPVKEQAKLFVDINKEQKPVSSALLWDLYSDIYRDTTDPKQQELRAVSVTVKRLNSNNTSPLYQQIKLPSQSKDIQKNAHLTLSRFCVAIKENRLLKKEENLFFSETYDKTTDIAYEVISAFLQSISKSFPEDWRKGEKGLLCSNVGTRILMNILRQLLKYLDLQGNKNLIFIKNKDRFNKETTLLLQPIIDKLKKMTPEERTNIRNATNREKIVENTQKLLWDLKEETNFGIELWVKGGWNPGVPKEESNDRIKDLIENTEIELKSFIVNELKMLYGDEWWDKGIPSDIKGKIKLIIKKDSSTMPRNGGRVIPNEERLRFAYTSQLKDLITNRHNWQQFERAFVKDKEIVTTAFRFYENLRNKYAHPERVKDLDEIEKGLGYWNMKWLRRCIGLSEL